MNTFLETLLERLELAGMEMRHNGDRWRGNCPACGGEDRFVITLHNANGEERPWFQCYGRCESIAILEALELTWADLYSRNGRVDELEIAPIAAIRTERVRWLEKNRIPLRGLTVCAGEKGLGKSVLTNARIVAQATTGALEGELQGQPVDALVITAEDDWRAVTKPRLQAHGADLDRVFKLNVLGDEGAMFTLPDHAAALELKIDHLRREQQLDLRLVVVDPIGAFLSSELDTHRDASVRRALAPLAGMADRLDLAVLVVAHLTKDQTTRMIHRVSGAGAFVNASRSLLVLARSPDDPDGEAGYERVLGHVASNWGQLAPALSVRIVSKPVKLDDGSTSPVAVFEILGETDISVDDLQRGVGTTREEAEEAIVEALRDGPRDALEVKKQLAKELGCSRRTIERAAGRMEAQGKLERISGATYPPSMTWALIVPAKPDGGGQEEASEGQENQGSEEDAGQLSLLDDRGPEKPVDKGDFQWRQPSVANGATGNSDNPSVAIGNRPETKAIEALEPPIATASGCPPPNTEFSRADPACRFSEHRSSDWALEADRTWSCGVCQAPSPALVKAGLVEQRNGAAPAEELPPPGGNNPDELTVGDGGELYVDVETGGLDPRSDQLVCVSFAGLEGDPVTFFHPAQRDQIQGALELDADLWGHNIGFDLHFLHQNGYLLPPEARWHDSLLVAHTAGRRKAGEAGLFRLASDGVKAGELDETVLESEQAIKAWLGGARRAARKAGREPPVHGDAPSSLLIPYVAGDVTLTRWARKRFSAELDGQDEILELERRLLPAVWHAERRGLPIDVEAAQELRSVIDASVAELHDRVIELAGGREDFNVGSSRQLEAALVERGVDVSELPRTPKIAAVMFTAEVLQRIEDELAAAVLAWRAEKKMSDYIRGILRASHGDRLYGSFRQVGTITGRMSSGRPNLQNIPAEDLRMRYLIRAGEGRVLVSADFDQMELRCLASYAPGGELERILVAGEDVHQRTADQLGITRVQGKTTNFGILYGAGANRVAAVLGISQEQARRAVTRWWRAWPEVRALRNKLDRQVRRNGYIRSALGRRHHFERSNHLLINYLISGSCADVFKNAVVGLHERELPLVNFIHDEVIVECDVDGAPEAAAVLEELMTRDVGPVKGLRADVSIAERWSDFKQPGYKP